MLEDFQGRHDVERGVCQGQTSCVHLGCAEGRDASSLNGPQVGRSPRVTVDRQHPGIRQRVEQRPEERPATAADVEQPDRGDASQDSQNATDPRELRLALEPVKAKPGGPPGCHDFVIRSSGGGMLLESGASMSPIGMLSSGRARRSDPRRRIRPTRQRLATGSRGGCGVTVSPSGVGTGIRCTSRCGKGIEMPSASKVRFTSSVRSQ